MTLDEYNDRLRERVLAERRTAERAQRDADLARLAPLAAKVEEAFVRTRVAQAKLAEFRRLGVV